MNQQRKRRFKSTYESDLKNKIKEKHNKQIIDWNNAAITPGTEFMENLHNKYHKLYCYQNRHKNYIFIISYPGRRRT